MGIRELTLDAVTPSTAPARTASKGGRSRGQSMLAVVEPPAARPFDVFEAKLRIPELQAESVSRPRLVNRLRAEQARIVLVAAAAGYGKTTLLAQWAARDERPFAWLSLDERDADEVTLVRHLAAAFDAVEPLDPSLHEALAAPGGPVWTTVAPRLAAAVTSCTRPFVLVLDNVELLRRGDPSAVVLALAKSLPEGSVLALSGRTPPPLPIARLRAAGWIAELGTEELAFGRRESQLLLRSVSGKLDNAVAAELVARTEGWPAGLHLAALAFDESVSRAAGGFDGAERYIRQYFQAEHLSRLAPQRLAFLRRTSVLAELSGPLCDATLAATGSADELERIERANLFLVPLDRTGGLYRCHGLWRDVLRGQLERHEPELVPVLHARAADWFEAQGDRAFALDHALAGGDADRAARLLSAIDLPADSERLEELEAWLERFAAIAPLDGHPAVAVLAGWVHALRGRAREAAQSLAAAEHTASDSVLPDGTPVRASVALLRAALCVHGVARMKRDVRAALAEFDPESPWVCVALVVDAAAALLAGSGVLAARQLAEAAEAAERVGATDRRAVAIAQRSLLAAAAGENHAAEQLALEARDLLANGAVSRYVTSAIVHAAAARAFLWHGRWDDARSELASAEALAGSLTEALPWLTVETRLALAGAYVALRDRPAAVAELAEIEKIVALRPHLGTRGAQVAELERQVAELPDGHDGRNTGLTPAELRLLPLLATHLSFREIGERLFVSRNTIKTQAISAYRKLGVSSRSAAIQRASELGLVEDASADSVDFIRTG